MLTQPVTDFLDESAIHQQADLVKDRLQHDAFSASLIGYTEEVPAGTVIAIQGTWGRGKTDALARTARALEQRHDESQSVHGTVWINPWQYGTPDLLTPLVVSLLERVGDEHRTSSSTLKRAAESIIRAGTSFGLKAASMLMPGGGLLREAAEPTDQLIAGLFEAGRDHDDVSDADPVQKMGQRFSELVDAVIDDDDNEQLRLVICIDDLDRCLPGRQVALLEALNFLVSSGARAVFIVAIDPTLATQAVHAHYGTGAFDADRYLDKMFQLRLNLPSIDRTAAESLVAGHLEAVFKGGKSGSGTCEQFFGLSPSDVARSAAKDSLPVAELRNPRVLRRVFDKVRILAERGVRSQDLYVHWERTTEQLATLFLLWLAMNERWPFLRASLQGELSGAHYRNVEELARYLNIRYSRYGLNRIRRRHRVVAAFESLPGPAEAPGLSQVVSRLDAVDLVLFKRWDAILRDASL